MSLKPFVNRELKEFFNTALERQRIYILKELGQPKPWTLDPIMQEGFFCNVFRDQDKTTKYFIELYAKYKNGPNLWATIVTCRYLSNIECVEALDKNGAFEGSLSDRLKVMAAVFCERMFEGDIINTTAFKLPEPDYHHGSSRAFYLIDLIEEIAKQWPKRLSSLGETWAFLTKFYNVDSFIAFQYTMDLSLTRYLDKAPDLNTWAAYGRGSTKGLARLVSGSPVFTEDLKEDFPAYASEIQARWVDHYMEIALPYFKGIMEELGSDEKAGEVYSLCNRFLSVRAAEVEHWLCEYDKYKDDWNKRRYISHEAY
jgi:hypothetical protein